MEKKQLTLTGHLSELRKRILITLGAVLIAAMVSFQFMDLIISYLIRPSNHMDFIYLGPSELFVAYVKIALAAGLIISSPVSLMQIWSFIRPGLKKKERGYLLAALIMGVFFFFTGAVFAYFTVIPITLDFFVQLTARNILPMYTFDKYLEFITSLILTFGVVFELPLIITLLSAMNLVKAAGLKKHRKIVILIIFILAAVLTPPDVISQILLALPMILLYELSILIASGIEGYRNKGRSAFPANFLRRFAFKPKKN